MHAPVVVTDAGDPELTRRGLEKIPTTNREPDAAPLRRHRSGSGRGRGTRVIPLSTRSKTVRVVRSPAGE